MPSLFGRDIGRDDLLKRVGDLSQVAGIRMMVLADGAERGVRIADVRTGSGLRFQVTLDRGMDLSLAEYRGIPLAFRTPTGDAHPALFEPEGKGWLRTFAGGLMTGCGMTYLGAPCRDAGENLGLHGRLSHLRATGVAASERWEGDECTLRLSGSLRESAMFGENLHLTRVIETRIGSSRIAVRDVVRNEGRARSPLMMLYHINAGWPLVDAGARLLLRGRINDHASSGVKTTPRDPDAAAGLELARSFTSPVAGFAEQVFYHDPEADGDGYASALLENGRLGLALMVRFRPDELRRLAEWKMMAEGAYVVGIEPANCGVEGRDVERRAGTLEFIEPGEERHFEVQIEIIDGAGNIGSAIALNRLA